MWEWFEPEWITEDIKMLLADEYAMIDVEDRSLEWDMDRATISIKGSVAVSQFLTTFRLRNKFRTVWNAMQAFEVDADVPVSFGNTYRRDRTSGYCEIYEFRREFDFIDEIYDDKPRYDRLSRQLDALEDEIADWMGQVHDRFTKYLRAEERHRCSEEWALEEAEAHEFKFTAEGEFSDD